MKTLRTIFFFITFSCIINVFAQDFVQNNDSSKWGYYLQIIDSSYIPKIASKDNLGYITLHTGISDYDAVFAKYKIKEFFQYVPDITGPLSQVYVIVCDSGQTQLGVELQEKYSNVIVRVEVYYYNPILTDGLIDNYTKEFGQRGNILLLGENNGLNKIIYFFDINGKIIYSTQTFNDSIDPSSILTKGFFVYNIKTGGNIKRGFYYNFK